MGYLTLQHNAFFVQSGLVWVTTGTEVGRGRQRGFGRVGLGENNRCILSLLSQTIEAKSRIEYEKL